MVRMNCSNFLIDLLPRRKKSLITKGGVVSGAASKKNREEESAETEASRVTDSVASFCYTNEINCARERVRQTG